MSYLFKDGLLYRVIYNCFAVTTLVILICYQISVSSPLLFKIPLFLTYLAVILGAAGIIIMFICILKYFPQLSGLKASYKDELQTNGLHKYVRHPLYLGTFLFITGLFFIYPHAKNLIVLVIIITYTMIGTIIEERKLILNFGDAYVNYKKKVPRIFPVKITLRP